MPIYEYECENCCERFELLRPISGKDDEIECPACGQASPERVFSVFGTVATGGSTVPCPSGGSA